MASEGDDRANHVREPLLDGIGTYSRPVSTSSPMAQRYFDQGLNLLFAFNHEASSRSFQEAAEIDPRCAMAWWGVAYAQGPHINLPMVSPEQAAVASNAISRARALSDGASMIERGLIEALATRCVPSPPEDRGPLERAYADAMRALQAQYPDDADVAILTAEALMNLRPWDLYSPEGDPYPGTKEIVNRIEQVMAMAPHHPLANHLYIHAIEASTRPERAKAAADRLRDLQPGLSHNVHMPSHIDVRLGQWEKAEVANRKAIEADRRYLAVMEYPDFYGLYIAHNYHMLAYAAIMRGRSAVAIEAIDEMMDRMPDEWAVANAAIADTYLAMPLEIRMRFGLWDEILAAPEPGPAFPISRAMRYYARAVSYAVQDQLDEARLEREAFLKARDQVPEASRFGFNAARDVLGVADRLMEGEILYREGDHEAGFIAMREATRLEDALAYSEPPDWIQPVRHALGASLLQSGRIQEAEAVYREDLKRLPENGWSLFGLWRALDLQDKTEEADQVRARWQAVWKVADVTLSSSCFCQPGR